MPLSSVLGASSVIKPGVCTSTTRPTVPYTGQLIFETDTSRLAVWTGSAWQYETAAAGPPGLVYITGATFTTATSVSLPNNTFNSTYRNYRLFLQLTALTADATFTMRLRASGTDDSSAQYDTMWRGITNQNGASDQSIIAGTSWGMAESDVSFPWYQLAIDICAPQIATPTHFLGNLTAILQNGSADFGRSGGGIFRQTTQFDSVSFISSAASSMTGVYSVYGYTDS